jgi:hypothetical protein
MEAYTTVAGTTFSLAELSAGERDYLAGAYETFRAGPAFTTFMDTVVHGTANPLLAASRGWVTDVVWHHPLYRALRDLAGRLGIAQHELLPEGDWRSDPLDDAWLSPTEAAREKGVTRTALYKAIARGELLARGHEPGGPSQRISRNSLVRWQPVAVRQRAGRARGARAAAGVIRPVRG